MVANSSSVGALQCRCCITGGGPAGMMMGLLLARAGIDTVVLEKHADFLRDFRGDTLHPSTLQAMHELGLLEELLKRPHKPVPQLKAQIGSKELVLADFSRLPTECRFIALMPQWDFLDFLAEQGRRYSAFHLRMQAEVTGLIENARRIAGVRAVTPNGVMEVRADLVVGADGRSSIVRQLSGLTVDEIGASIDVLWMRLSKKPNDPPFALRFDQGKVLVTLDRGDYWQCGLVIPKGGAEKIRQRGVEALRGAVTEVAPFLSDRICEMRDWNEIRLLTVKIDQLRQWYRPGLICIGDAAHAMSPIGGVGINLAIQDAIAAANILARPLAERSITPADLGRVQRRRSLPSRITQAFQVMVQKQFVARVLDTPSGAELPWLLRQIFGSRLATRIRSRIIGIGICPEHIRTPDTQK
jgi:2-polyprenyl-6-methoxyphenol hydroxylase-like FAD-dependent oxidoreductase